MTFCPSTRICFAVFALALLLATTVRSDEVAEREWQRRVSASDPTDKTPDVAAIYWREETARRYRSVKAGDPSQQLIAEVQVIREILRKLSTTNAAEGEAAGDEDAARLVQSAERCRTLVDVLHENRVLTGDHLAQFEKRFAQLQKSAKKIQDTSSAEKRQELASELLQALDEKEREKFRVKGVPPTMLRVGPPPKRRN